METITIPSPSAFLASSPAPSPKQDARKTPPPSSSQQQSSHKRRPSSSKGKQSTPKQPNPKEKKITGVTKPKQSKSRNGCITCKAKRLKCDESKPSCQQCHKRNVVCGGYKKDFKWRPFEETTFASRLPANVKKKPPDVIKSSEPPSATTLSTRVSPEQEAEPEPEPNAGLSASETSTPTPEPDGDTEMRMDDSFFQAAAPTPPSFQMLTNTDFPDFQFDPIFDMSTPPYLREPPRRRFEPNAVTSSLMSLFEDVSAPSPPKPPFFGQSPRLMDLLLNESELSSRSTVSLPPSVSPSTVTDIPTGIEIPFRLDGTQGIMHMGDEEVEEIIRERTMANVVPWAASYRNPAPTPLGTRSLAVSPAIVRDDPFNKIFRQPDVQAGSPEMLMLRFDKQTCGILSIKDGPTENPWRTLIWPLARDSPALYHAIASMTAFHTSKEKPTLRVDGMEHMRSSIRSLATGIEKMRTDTALATTLVLAFAESWDQHISTGIEHLRGAKILVNQALIKHQKNNLTGDDLARLKFLCNTWVYMDVIARLTSVDDDEVTDLESFLLPLNLTPLGPNVEVDPLMGCASSLFPYIGRVANLCRKVRKAETNSIAIISQAMELKQAIEQWAPAPSFERPEDPSSEIQHALQTAEAYRYATLLYLHQAVPEIPSLTSAQLAKKVLVYLATVPLSSRLVIVQIYPLLAAGCEAQEREDRQWVEERWASMASRMWIGNIDRCLEVMQEVWARKDEGARRKEEAQNQRKPGARPEMMAFSESSKRKFEEERALDDMFSFSDMLKSNILAPPGSGQAKKSRASQSGSFSREVKRKMEPITEELDIEVTVRGSCHWVGVMKDWEWEILLG